jgi:predicted nucleic acid-binding protein
MMPAVFLDTSGAIALLHTADPYHAKASELASTFVKQSRRRITTAAVLTEFGDGFARKGRWKIAAEYLSALMADPPRSCYQAG